MKFSWTVALLGSMLGTAWGSVAPERGVNAELSSPRIEIRIAPDDWGGASPRDIHKLLLSAAKELSPYFSQRRLDPILVRQKTGAHAPIVFYQRSARNEYIVELDVRGRYWSQYAYQFSHELCHILARYEKHRGRQNKWFEESLCELAALFTLRRMFESWQTSPPYENWSRYAPYLGEYAESILAAPRHRLPEGQALSEWLRESEAELGANPTLRAKNATVAVQLLPLFDRAPAHWEAISYLNLGEASRPDLRFSEFLENWKKTSPERHRGFIDRVVSLLYGRPA